MRWATHQFMHHLSRIRGRTDTEMWREKRGKGNFGVSISCTKGGTKGAKNCHMSHALVVLFYGEAVCQVLSNMIQSVFRLVLSSGEIQGWPKELVMGCENFSNLCVVIGGTIGGVGRLRCQKRVALRHSHRRALGHPLTAHNLHRCFLRRLQLQ